MKKLEIEHAEVLGVDVTPVGYAQLVSIVRTRDADHVQTFAFCNVHSIMSARRSESLREALYSFDLRAPDGMPLVWAMNWLYGLQTTRTHGPTAMRHLLRHCQGSRWRHFLLGSTDATLARLVDSIQLEYPRAVIAGTYSPPFEPLTDSEVTRIAAAVDKSGANIVWVGMGMPKQELLIPRLASHLRGVSLLGVGAAFDIVSGVQPEAPHWMQGRGLEWLFRLAHEPKRLWQRYAINNPLFIALVARDFVARRLRRLLKRN